MGQGLQRQNKSQQVVWGHRLSPTRIRIVELPLGVWTESYKRTLINLEAKGVVKAFAEQNTEEGILFDVELAVPLGEAEAKEALKLSSRHNKSMYLHDPNDALKFYRDELDVIEDFYDVRMDFYAKRKEHQVEVSGDELRLLENRSRFVDQVCSGELDVRGMTIDDLARELSERGFGRRADTYDYLLKMPMVSMTSERANELRRDVDGAAKAHDAITRTCPQDMWLGDLDALKQAVL